jgi:hypothetical protein
MPWQPERTANNIAAAGTIISNFLQFFINMIHLSFLIEALHAMIKQKSYRK